MNHPVNHQESRGENRGVGGRPQGWFYSTTTNEKEELRGDVRHVSSLDRLSSRYLLALRRRARQRKREQVGLVLESVELSLGGEALTATCDVEERGGGGGRCTRQC